MAFKKSAFLMTGLAALLASSVTFAKNINLYEQPKTDAKVVATIDPAAGIVPIFTPKTGDWVKVGDPRNGNVGWVKSSELAQSGNVSTGFSFSQKIVDQGKGQQSYVFQFGVPAQLTAEQTKALEKQIKAQQAAIQQAAQRLINDVFTGYSASSVTGFPMILPVVVVPQQEGNAPPVSQKK